jgi:hypothetical protein
VRGVHERWCAIIEGLPIAEACEHGVHRVMDALFDPRKPPPVPGVVTPKNASPAFRALLAASNELLRAYAARAGGLPADSTYHPEPSAAWLALDTEARLEAIRDAWSEVSKDAELDPAHSEAASLRDRVKVRVDFADAVPVHERRLALMRIEASLKERVEGSLVVEREARKDLNVIRRL